MEDCKLCGTPTEQVFNIRMKQTPICVRCENTIVKQSVMAVYDERSTAPTTTSISETPLSINRREYCWNCEFEMVRGRCLVCLAEQ